jgi:hypothetical protein
MRPYLITAKLMRPSNMKRFPTPGLDPRCRRKDGITVSVKEMECEDDVWLRVKVSKFRDQLSYY